MSSVAILPFLVGAVLAWGFRVWILIPITLLAMTGTLVYELVSGAGVLAAFGYSLLFSLPTQIGYAFGLSARFAMVMTRSSRSASVAALYKQRSLDQIS